jgi:hypothetical protein
VLSPAPARFSPKLRKHVSNAGAARSFMRETARSELFAGIGTLRIARKPQDESLAACEGISVSFQADDEASNNFGRLISCGPRPS